MKLPEGVSARLVPDVNGLSVRVLEAGAPGAPLALLLHGFPELAYSWRKVIAPLAAAGFHVVAPDQRGYGGTTGWSRGYDIDMSEFSILNLVEDVAALLTALGIERAHAVVGHDFGSFVASAAALTRPERFGAVAMMSAPFGGPPGDAPGPSADFHARLAALDPPREHYQWFYSTREAAPDMLRDRADFCRFMRAYYYCKSADWPGNAPHRLGGWSAEALAEMPRYYIMNRGEGMHAAALSMAPPADYAPGWLTDEELSVYVDAFTETGIQAALNWYRGKTSGDRGLADWRGRKIEVPATFIAGAQDWGVWQSPGALEAMETRATADWRGTTLIEGAGHWVQQEKPDETLAALLAFLREA